MVIIVLSILARIIVGGVFHYGTCGTDVDEKATFFAGNELLIGYVMQAWMEVKDFS